MVSKKVLTLHRLLFMDLIVARQMMGVRVDRPLKMTSS